MTTFAPHRAPVESFIDCMHSDADSDADKDAVAPCLAENVVLYSPLNEPPTGNGTIADSIRYSEPAGRGKPKENI
jgi:hypothetical protein